MIRSRVQRRRERSLANEVGLLRRIVAVALRDKTDAQRLLAVACADVRNGVPLVVHIAVCQQLHVAEARIRDLEEIEVHRAAG